jgi:hypothetical protein
LLVTVVGTTLAAVSSITHTIQSKRTVGYVFALASRFTRVAGTEI